MIIHDKIKEGAFVRYMAEVRALSGLCIARTPKTVCFANSKRLGSFSPFASDLVGELSNQSIIARIYLHVARRIH